ncbi:RHS domain-containing protein [Streptococcus timonensis]|uniref:RHS domain-containing protein n=1 Tax=Streptococcus TaxID=1301 RepID=UPI001F1CA37E|nr:RHS domain-containing protein [Streptococcus infantis]
MCGTHEPLAQVCNWTTEDVESRQQTHYFHCDQIGIPREMTDDKGDLVRGLLRMGNKCVLIL